MHRVVDGNCLPSARTHFQFVNKSLIIEITHLSYMRTVAQLGRRGSVIPEVTGSIPVGRVVKPSRYGVKGFTSTVLPGSDVPHFCGTRIPIRLTIYFKIVRSWHIRLCSKSMEHGLPNSAVNRGSLSKISPRDEPWSQKDVSVKTRAQPSALINSITATRCTILLNRSTNTRIS